MKENLIIATLLITNVFTLFFLGGIYWRKRVWKRRAKIADWPENVLLYNINKMADWAERCQAWIKRQNPKEIQDKQWPEKFDDET